MRCGLCPTTRRALHLPQGWGLGRSLRFTSGMPSIAEKQACDVGDLPNHQANLASQGHPVHGISRA